MTMKISKHALDRLRAEAKAYREMQQTLVTGLIFEPGTLGFRLKNEVIGILGGALAEVFRDMTKETAGNYVEMEMTQATDAVQARASLALDRFTLTIQKHQRPTPTTLRMKAEFALLDLVYELKQAMLADPEAYRNRPELVRSFLSGQGMVDTEDRWNVTRKARYLLHRRVLEAAGATYEYMRAKTRPEDDTARSDTPPALRRKPAPGAWALYDAVLELRGALEVQLGIRPVDDSWATIEEHLANSR
jgi:hypothetical protein